MSVAIAVTVTFPNSTAAGMVATGLDVSQTVGRLLIQELTQDVMNGKNQNVAGATVSTVIT